ncbi:hypothetical protein TSAR_001458 [Trichomalopsis sarcophagae]|uniref:Uncharacterized protein n=1 Tax=Trichomalopsis sarcophagae TaxID=543379 RepID=A0A232EGN1_9HYME|nr:hypothetical protein TSAR_001458 [Trichomalopsis sarcophagae]
MSRIFQGEIEAVVQYTNRLKKIVFKIKELKRLEETADAELKRFEDKLDAEAAEKYKKGL